MRPLLALLAAAALAGRGRCEDDMQHCVWRVTLRAVPEGPLEEDLWHPSASVEDAKLSCLHDAVPPRRCAGFAWRRGGRGAAAGEYTPLSFDRVKPLHRTDARVDVYQHACWPLDGAVVAVMTTLRRPLGQSYVVRSASSVAAEGLPLLIADANPNYAAEVADWALSRPGGVRYVRIPDGSAGRVQAALAARDAKRRAAAGVGALRTFSYSERATDTWRWKETLDWAWAVAAAVRASDASYVLYLEDDMVLAEGAADDLADRLAEWAVRDGGAADVAAAAQRALYMASPPPRPPAWRVQRVAARPPPPLDTSKGWMGLSLWSADDLPDGHPCDNCYTKALVLPHQTATVLAEYVEQRFMEKPIDWLLADVERASGSRLRALVPALAEHVGDQSSLAGVRREWQRSAYFKHVPFKGAGEPMRRHSPPPGAAVEQQRRGSDVLSDTDTDDSPPAPPYDGRGAPWRTATERSSDETPV